MIAAPVLIPLKPLGAKPLPPGTRLWEVQFDGLIRNTPTAMKKRMSPTFSSTIALLVFADSLIPMTRIQVITITTRNAGRLKITGTPRRCGALVTAPAKYAIEGSVVPAATARAAPNAERSTGAG